MASADPRPPSPGLRHPVVTFIGDVHGWADRLERILDQVEGFPIFLGDLIDRGPDAPAVVERVRALCLAGRAACVIGNHEYALVRGLGVPELGIPADEDMFAAWAQRYGGHAVLSAYGVVGDDAQGLRERLGDRLSWMANLPWLLSGGSAGRRWLAVHAGLGAGLLAEQLPALEGGIDRLRLPSDDLPAELYAKNRAYQVPVDCPEDLCIVSGHTPIPDAYVSAKRILCDTSGGMRGRRLSAVIWPSGRVITS